MDVDTQGIQAVEIIPLTEFLFIAIDDERQMYLINQAVTPPSMVQLGYYTGGDTGKFKLKVMYVVHGPEIHPAFN